MGILGSITNEAASEPLTMKQMVLCLCGKPCESLHSHPVEPVMTADQLRQRMRRDYLDAIARQGIRMTASIDVNLPDDEHEQRNDDRRVNGSPLVTTFPTRSVPTTAS